MSSRRFNGKLKEGYDFNLVVTRVCLYRIGVKFLSKFPLLERPSIFSKDELAMEGVSPKSLVKDNECRGDLLYLPCSFPNNLWTTSPWGVVGVWTVSSTEGRTPVSVFLGWNYSMEKLRLLLKHITFFLSVSRIRFDIIDIYPISNHL